MRSAAILVLLTALAAASHGAIEPVAPAGRLEAASARTHAPLAGETLPGRRPRCQTQTDAEPPRGSGQEEATREVEIHPSLPPFVFRWVPDLSSTSSERPAHVGRIEVSKKGNPGPPQSIEIWSHVGVSWVFQTFYAEDVNFDGYQDIGILSDHGAKWGRIRYWLFDPASGRFVTNRLSRELSRLGANERRLDPGSRTITVEHLTFGEAPVSETYRVGKNGLTLIEARERRVSPSGGHDIVTLKVVNGKRRVVKVEKAPEQE
jgi:hypothetical protein